MLLLLFYVFSEAAQNLNEGTSGDALYLIANEFETTVEKLLELNPGANLNKSIKVGQVINVPVQKPKISIKTIETQVLTAVEPKTYQTQYDDTKPSSYQEKFARQMTEAGADIIIGTHPHVVQPVEWVESENGNKSLCYYSLGNYVSTQKQALCMLEAMAWVTIHVDENGPAIDVENTGVLPLVCHYNAMPVRLERVYLLEEYTEEQAASHGIKAYGGVNLYLQDLQDWSEEVFGENVLGREQVLQENQ